MLNTKHCGHDWTPKVTNGGQSESNGTQGKQLYLLPYRRIGLCGDRETLCGHSQAGKPSKENKTT